jgi:hypothetical protein
MRTGEFVEWKWCLCKESLSRWRSNLHLGIKSSKDLVSGTKVKDMSELSIVHVFILIDLEFSTIGFYTKRRITSK